MVETGEAVKPASHVVLRSEGRKVGSKNKNLTLSFGIWDVSEFNPGAMPIALRKARP
jgi:hypothetical protein